MSSPFLRYLNQTAFENTHEKGKTLEYTVEFFLTVDVVQQRRFANVWLWDDYPDRNGRPDEGIDLVAIEHKTGRRIAIQCKFYSPGANVTFSDIATFLASYSTGEFDAGILVITTNLAKKAHKIVTNRNPPIEVWRPDKFDASTTIDWDNRTVSGGNPTYQAPSDDQDYTAKSYAEEPSDPIDDQGYTAEPYFEDPPVPPRHIQPQPIPYRSQPAYAPRIEPYSTYQSPNKKPSLLSRNLILIVLSIIAGVIGVAAAIMFFIRVEGALNIIIAIGAVLGIFALFGVFRRS